MGVNIKLNGITYNDVESVKLPLADNAGEYALFNLVVDGEDTGGDEGGEPVLITDGLVNYFDFRSCEYNNNGAGGSTIISASQGDGSLFCWSTGKVTSQDENGAKIDASLFYNPTTVGTTNGKLTSSYTVIMKCNMLELGNPLFNTNFASLSNAALISYKPQYELLDGSKKNIGERNMGVRSAGYRTLSIVVDNELKTCKLYDGETLLDTQDGSSIDNFSIWSSSVSFKIINGNGYFCQIAIYDKVLSEIEIVEMNDYLKTLEV